MQRFNTAKANDELGFHYGSFLSCAAFTEEAARKDHGCALCKLRDCVIKLRPIRNESFIVDVRKGVVPSLKGRLWISSDHDYSIAVAVCSQALQYPDPALQLAVRGELSGVDTTRFIDTGFDEFIGRIFVRIGGLCYNRQKAFFVRLACA